VEIGTIQPGVPMVNDWLPTISGRQVAVQGARLDLALDDPTRWWRAARSLDDVVDEALYMVEAAAGDASTGEAHQEPTSSPWT
jgi:hypothetical protein